MRLDAYDNSDFVRGVGFFKEVSWWIFRSLIFSPWFPLPSFLKVMVLKMHGARIGKNVVIRSRVNITFPWKLTVGNHVWIGDEVLILSLAPVVIGSHVCISQRAFLCTGSHNHHAENFDLVTAPISIGEGTWIGASVFVAPGVTLAAGTLCAAGAVVLRDTEPGARIGGNPARDLSRSDPR